MIVTDCPLSSMPDAREHRFSHRGHRNGADPRSNPRHLRGRPAADRQPALTGVPFDLRTGKRTAADSCSELSGDRQR